jgi:hypothetical protein
MGLGKTLTAIALLCHLMEEKENHGPFCTTSPSFGLFRSSSLTRSVRGVRVRVHAVVRVRVVTE